ncbi:uncharacterized protein [Nicotiana tomentosiformis]|uniref:uncharacterized protein n=1 Tax=Nicotiana tomentosiformis TaxID=4098 RepID=UPI00388CB5C3
MGDGTLRYQGLLCVPNVDGLQERIMTEAHTSRYSMNPGSTKLYHDLKEVYWWNDMKRNIADLVARYPNCQKVNDKHQRHAEQYAQFHIKEIFKLHGNPVSIISVRGHSLRQIFGSNFSKTNGQAERTIQTLEDMLRACALDFKELIGPDLMHQAMENVKIIKERSKTSQSRQKSYSDIRRRDLEFKDNDWGILESFPHEGCYAIWWIGPVTGETLAKGFGDLGS